jgi:hypothetical protein
MTAYATLADFLSTYEVAPSSGRNARILAALDEASTMLDGAIGWDFSQHPLAGAEVHLLDGNGTNRLCVHQGIVSLTSLEVAWVTGAPYNMAAATDYFLDPAWPELGEPFTHISMSEVGNYTILPPGQANIRLSGVFGYAAVPIRVKRATVALARQIYRADATTPGGMAGPDEWGGGAMPRGWPDDAYRCLDYYRHRDWCRV